MLDYKTAKEYTLAIGNINEATEEVALKAMESLGLKDEDVYCINTAGGVLSLLRANKEEALEDLTLWNTKVCEFIEMLETMCEKHGILVEDMLDVSADANLLYNLRRDGILAHLD